MVLGGSSDVYRKEGFYAGSTRKDGRRVIVVLTTNNQKKQEFEETLGAQYGCNVIFKDPATVLADGSGAKVFSDVNTPEAVQNPEAIKAVEALAANWNEGNAASPQFVIREECRLYCLRTHKQLDSAAIVADPESAPNFVADKSFLAIWALRWDKDTGKLIDVEPRWFEHTAHGYIDPARKHKKTDDTFGHDHIFVVPQLGRSYDEMKQLGGGSGKVASRQLVVDSFIHKYLIYDKPKGLEKNALAPARAVEFTKEMSVAHFLRTNPYTSNPNRSKWRIDKFQSYVLNQGIFFRAATSRPQGNYFSPPLGGVPLTTKKDAVEETVFMCHDIGHQHVPDLVFDGQDLDALPKDERRAIINVYCIWRMLSEATTMVLGDCLYADTLATTSEAHVQCLDKRIYPLFLAVRKKASEDGKADMLTTIKRLLWCNTSFALLGDKSEWASHLENDSKQAELDAFTNHFEKFFVGDQIWTHANFMAMAKNHSQYREWNDMAGARLTTAGLPRVSEVVAELRKRNAPVSGPYNHELVRAVFEYLFDTRIAPIFGNDDPVQDLPDEARLSNAFRRYILGQLFFYARFSAALPDLSQRGRALVAAIDGCAGNFDEAARAKISAQFAADVRYVWGMGVITASAAESYLEIHPIFQPVYISYYSLPYKTVPEALKGVHLQE